jgi:hypothetical protein
MAVPTLDPPSGKSINFMAVFSIKATSEGVEKTGSNPEPSDSAVCFALTISI